MRRKVIQQGPSTLMISLPSKWAKENSIRKGEEIELNIENNQLIVSSSEISKEKVTKITLNSKDTYLDRIIMSKYRENYDTVIVEYDDISILDDIKKTLTYLLGFEIVDQNKTSCTIQNVSEGSDKDFPKMFRRMFQIVNSMSESCLEYVKTKEEKYLRTSIELREMLIKIEQFNLRIINKNNSFSLNQKTLEYFYVWHLSTFGKSWASLAKNELFKIKTFSKEDSVFFEEVTKFAMSLYETYYSKKKDNLIKMKKELYRLRPIGADLLDNSKNKMVIFYLLRLLNRTYEVIQHTDFEIYSNNKYKNQL